MCRNTISRRPKAPKNLKNSQKLLKNSHHPTAFLYHRYFLLLKSRRILLVSRTKGRSERDENPLSASAEIFDVNTLNIRALPSALPLSLSFTATRSKGRETERGERKKQREREDSRQGRPARPAGCRTSSSSRPSVVCVSVYMCVRIQTEQRIANYCRLFAIDLPFFRPPPPSTRAHALNECKCQSGRIISGIKRGYK